jgi:NTE family protein
MSEPGPAADAGGIALALGGGGARGLAHIGVLQVLQEAGLRVSAVAGASMGGLLGALFAAGVPLVEIERETLRFAKTNALLKLVELVARRGGLTRRGRRVYEPLLRLLSGDRRIESLPIPLALLAADLESGRAVVLRRGSVAEAVRATISIPGVFRPVEREGMRLVDGGILDNVPAGVAATLTSRPVVAVDVLPRFAGNVPGEPAGERPLEPPAVPRFLHDLITAAQLMIAELTELRRLASPPALTLRPAISPEVTLVAGFHLASETIAAGRRAAVAELEQLRELARPSTAAQAGERQP